MFRIAEEYTKTIKTNPDEKYFFILAKIDFQIFKNHNFEKKSENRIFKNRNFQLKFHLTPIFQKSILNYISIENLDFDFSDFFQSCDF